MNITLPPDEDRPAKFRELLQAVQSFPSDQPLYITLLTVRPEPYIIEPNEVAGISRDKKSAVTVTFPADHKRLVSVRRL